MSEKQRRYQTLTLTPNANPTNGPVQPFIHESPLESAVLLEVSGRWEKKERNVGQLPLMLT